MSPPKQPHLFCILNYLFAKQDVDKGIDVGTIDAADTIHVGAAVVVLGVVLASEDVDEGVQVVAVDLATTVHIAIDTGIYRRLTV